MEYLLGIDLGTTNCTVTAVDENGKTTVIRNRDGEFVTPSAVYFCEKENNFIVGKKAKELTPNDTDGRLVTLVKRQMGCEKNKVRKNPITGKYKPYEYWNKIFSPEEISSKILKQLKEDAEAQLGTKVSQAVITCPAYFKQAQKEATRIAGELAGFEVLEVITEPTAAALSYSTVSKFLKENGRERVFVFDLGGGTFDATIIDLLKDENGISSTTKCTDGDARLGGADWDNICRGNIIEMFNKKFGIKFNLEKGTEKEKTVGQLTLDVEKLKKELSNPNVDSAKITMEYKGHSVEEIYTREKYANITNEFTEKCRIKCSNLMKDANMTWDNIDTILMVGSMSNCLFIQDSLRKLSDKEILFGQIDPKTCVSEGAAIHAYKKYCDKKGSNAIIHTLEEKPRYDMAENNSDEIEKIIKNENEGKRTSSKIEFVSSVLPASICLKGMRGGKEVCKKMLLKNHTYPCSFESDYPMSFDNMTEVKLPVLEGESENPLENTELGQVILSLDCAHKRGDMVHVKFEIDGNGIIQVSAIDKKTNKSVTGEIKRNSLLSLDEIEQAKNDSENDFFLI